MELSIDFLKNIALAVYNKINPILGLKQNALKQQKDRAGNFSKNIDLIAEEVVIDCLEKASIDILLISEEIGEKYVGDKEKAIKSRHKLIVDPIDGSNNAIRGIPFCSTSIAFARGDTIDDLTKSVVLDLITKSIYWADKGKGAYLNDERIYVSDNDILKNCILELNFPMRKIVEELTKYNLVTKKFYRIRVMGSTALSLCQISKGSVDAFIDLAEKSRLVDTAGGILILREAGGKIFSKGGNNFNEKLSFDSKFSFVASNAKLEAFLKENLNKIDNNY